MRKMMIRMTALSLLALPLAATAQAQTTAQAPTGPSMSMAQMVEHLTGQGYTNIKDAKAKGEKLFEVEATAPGGQRQELLIDARTGEILRTERD